MFGKYYGSSNSFYYIPFYDYWFQAADEISREHNVYYFKTEDVALEILLNNFKKGSDERKIFFCDHVHPTLLGNILTAEIINDYLIKTYDLK